MQKGESHLGGLGMDRYFKKEKSLLIFQNEHLSHRQKELQDPQLLSQTEKSVQYATH